MFFFCFFFPIKMFFVFFFFSIKMFVQSVLYLRTVFALNIRTPQLLTIYVLKFEPV